MNLEIEEIIEVLKNIIPELSSKPKNKINLIIEELKKLPEENIKTSILMKIQEDIEGVSLMKNIDPYSRNEIINVLSMFEMIF